MKCYCCQQEIEDELYSEYKLKDNKGNVNICIECENSQEIYLDKIKRNCLIDGQVYEVSRSDEKIINSERALRAREEESERKYNCKKSIYYFSNAQKFQENYQAIKYCNGFLGVAEDSEDNIQRMKFNYSINKHWIIDETWDKDLGKIDIYLDNFNKEIQKVKKPEETEWRERTRIWWSGKIVCEEDFYNATFGFSTYSDYGEEVNDVYVNYQFICSKSYKLSKKIMQLLKEDGWNVIEDKK